MLQGQLQHRHSSIFMPYTLLLVKCVLFSMTYLGKKVFLLSMTILEENKGWEEEGRENQEDLGSWALSDTFQCVLIQSIWQANVSSFVVSFSVSQQ